MRATEIGDREQGAVGPQRPRVESARPGKSVAILNTVLGSGLISSALTAIPKIRACVLAENQLVREVLCRSLAKHEKITAVGVPADGVFTAAGIPKKPIDVLVLVSSERVQADLEQISAIRKQAPGLKILLMGSVKEDAEFLRYVRAGINGYLWREASAADVTRAIETVHGGKAVCPGELCAALFRFFEDAEPRLQLGSPTQRLGLTRREQQIVPLIAKGFTNKEIANHFCLSEQTVKNHLFRMKLKMGAEDRLSIVQKFRHHGLLL
jgi:DNA-binding NarL/FixJ family response regulator